MKPSVVKMILNKKRGHAHDEAHIDWLVEQFTKGQLPDYQMAAWLMAVCFQGLDATETAALTRAMRDSGVAFDFSSLKKARIDKHSTGGVGDKTTLILAPLVASLGIHVPMIAGRGLGHTGGTLDKLESLPGFRTHLEKAEFEKLVAQNHLAIMGQTPEICPADRKLYALRDVTGTVDSIPLICASIMSKKMSEGLTGLVLDVKVGSGAFMKSVGQARSLAHLLKETGNNNGLAVTVVLSNMDQPLGRFAGNYVEVKECVDLLSGKSDLRFYDETLELSLVLAAHMIVLGGLAKDFHAARALAEEQLRSGAALEKFRVTCELQGAKSLVNSGKCHQHEILATADGTIESMDAETIGLALVDLGAGRKTSADKVDPLAGIEFLCKTGDHVKAGAPIARLFASTPEHFSHAATLYQGALRWTNQVVPPNHKPLILETIT